MPKGSTTEARFFEKVDKWGPLILDSSCCWQWRASSGDRRYGQFWLNGKIEKAHRASYRMFVGEIPDGRIVLHRCDNTRCVRPDHLVIGNPLANTQDCRRKGRMYLGVRKLNPDDAHAIRVLCAARVKIAYIADLFGVNMRSIQKIKRGQAWTEETPDKNQSGETG